jgi:sigma-B regulation protein RsbU (phosphoserine phosphatase)
MATARTEGAEIVEALELGANDYVTKPLDFPVVFARVKTQLDLRQAVRRALALEKRLARDLQAASRVQDALLPRGFQPPPGVRVAWAFKPCDELAGDALNVCRLDADHIALYVLDAVGHGVASALLAVTVTRVLSPAAGQDSLLLQPGDGTARVVPPAVVADRLALQFPFDDRTEMFFTLAYAVLDVPNKALRYVSAGHPPGVLVPGDGGPLRFLPGTGLPVGLGTGYEEHALALANGDRVYWYSDGVPEAFAPSGEMYGNDRLLATLVASRGLPLAESVARVEAEVRAWCEAAPADDVSVLALEAD